jgi:putative oxidoreductase
LFDAIGIGQWFRYVTGLIEVGSAIALLVPSFAVFGALALAATMVGAIVTHFFIVGGAPAMPAILLLGSAAVVWTRRHQVLGDRQTVR